MRTISPFFRSALILLGSILLMTIGACAIQLRPVDETNSTSSAASQEDQVAAKLAQCRTVTVDQTTALDECRRIWMENRHRFLGPRSTEPVESSTGSSRSKPTPQDK